MSESKKQTLIQEAKMQTEALLRLGVWQRAAFSLMAAGILLIFWSFGFQTGILKGIVSVLGGLLAVIAGFAAFLIRTGRKNGKKNVENILKAAEDL